MGDGDRTVLCLPVQCVAGMACFSVCVRDGMFFSVPGMARLLCVKVRAWVFFRSCSK